MHGIWIILCMNLSCNSGFIAGVCDEQADFFPCCNQATRLKSWRTWLLFQTSLVLCNLAGKCAAAVLRRFTWLNNKRLRTVFAMTFRILFSFLSFIIQTYVLFFVMCVDWNRWWLHVCPRDNRIRERNHSVPKPRPYCCPYCLQELVAAGRSDWFV